MSTQSIDFKTLFRTGKFSFGYRSTLRSAKKGTCKAIVVSKACLEEVRKGAKALANQNNIPLIEYPGSSYELGASLGKPFPISVLAVLDSGTVPITQG